MVQYLVTFSFALLQIQDRILADFCLSTINLRVQDNNNHCMLNVCDPPKIPMLELEPLK